MELNLPRSSRGDETLTVSAFSWSLVTSTATK